DDLPPEEVAFEEEAPVAAPPPPAARPARRAEPSAPSWPAPVNPPGPAPRPPSRAVCAVVARAGHSACTAPALQAGGTGPRATSRPRCPHQHRAQDLLSGVAVQRFRASPHGGGDRPIAGAARRLGASLRRQRQCRACRRLLGAVLVSLRGRPARRGSHAARRGPRPLAVRAT